MLTRLGILILIATAVMASKCKPDDVFTVSDACQQIYKLLYADGRFALTVEEYRGLRRGNQIKVTDLKAWFKSECPDEYAKTAGGKK